MYFDRHIALQLTGMAGAQLPSFHDTFIRIAEGLKVLKQIHVTGINASETLYTAKNADAEVPVVGAKIQSSPASQSNPSFRKRKRKQENDKIFRVDLAKAEEEDVLEQLKAEECRYFVKYFGELLPNFTPGDAVLKETANLSQNLEVCKRLIGRAGRFIREKDIELEAENTRVEELEEILSREQKFKEELKSGLVELQDTVKAIVAATEEGSKTNCLYCSSVLRELGEQKNQDMVEFVLKPPKTDHLTLSESAVISDANVVAECETPAKNALEEALPLNSREMSSEVFPLKRLKNGPDGFSDEMELYIRTSEISTKSNGSPKSNEKFQNMLLMNCKSSSVFPEFQQPGNVTGVYLQREAKEPTRSYGKEIDIHQIHINLEEGKQSKSVGDANERENGEGNDCKCVGDGNGKENGAVDSGESQAKMSTVRVVDGNECKSVGDGIEKENGGVDSGESQANMSTVRVMEEELCGPVENCERTGLYNDSASMSDIKEGYGFIEMKCGCTSRDQIDTLGTLRIYESGAFEIYCQCKRGCNNGEPMTPVAFESHGGCGHNRKWRYSIWILMKDEKVQMLKAKILEPYYRKYKEKKKKRTSQMKIGQTDHCNGPIPDQICLEKSRLRQRIKEDCNIQHNALGTAEWRSSRTPYDRKEGNFSNRGSVSCFAKEDDLQKKNGCYNLRSR